MGAVRYEHWYELSRLKNGRFGSRAVMCFAPYSPIHACQLCGVLGGARKVCCRNDVYGWNVLERNDYSTESLSTLCTACWNVARALNNRRRLVDEIARLARKLEKEARDAKQGRTDARFTATGDRTGEGGHAAARAREGDGIARAPGDCFA